jgi:hypothetical protein
MVLMPRLREMLVPHALLADTVTVPDAAVVIRLMLLAAELPAQPDG